jgi:hypothetical protein
VRAHLIALLIVAAAHAQEPAPPPQPAQPGELIPFLVGSSHPELPRPAPTPTEVRAVRVRVIAYLDSWRRPGVQETRDLAERIGDVVAAGKLGYIDAAYIVRQLQLILDSGPLTKRRIHDAIADFRGRLADTPLPRKDTDKLMRDVRALLASALNELP